jgi:alcohol dehydrogenase
MLVATLQDWVQQLDVPGLASFGMTHELIEVVVADSPGSSMRTNPVALDDSELAEVLRRSL